MDAFERIVKEIDPHGKLLGTWKLTGGVSAEITAMTIVDGIGRTRRLIVRRYGEFDLKHNPHVADHEYSLLRHLNIQGLPVPQPYHVDETGEILPSPFIVVEYIEGETDFAPVDLARTLRQMADHLTRIHQIKPATLGLHFLPDLTQKSADWIRTWPEVLDDSLSERQIREVLGAVWPVPPINAPCLLHGDFWPGNLLWINGRLTGIIDWEDAAVGDPLADLAITRLDLLWAYGNEAMQQFTDHYLATSGIDATNQPYWDLWAALRPCGRLSEWAGDPIKERSMREKHVEFITAAFEKL